MRLTVLFAVILTAVLAASASPTASAQTAPAHDTLVIGVTQFPPDLHPDFVATDAKFYLLNLGQRQIVRTNLDGEIVCQLCTEVPSLANGRVKVNDATSSAPSMDTTFTLRSDLFWADGMPVTTRDVLLATEVGKAIDPAGPIDRVDIVDAYTFRVHRRVLSYDFASVVLPGSNYLLPSQIEAKIWQGSKTPLEYAQHSAYNRAPSTPGLWLGPYRVTAMTAAGTLTAEPNPYWKGARPAFKQIAVRLIDNSAALEANLLSGDVDVISSELAFPLNQSIQLSKANADRFDVFFRSTGSVEHLSVALGNPLLADKRVRQALLMAIDREAIADKLFEGRETVANALLSPSETDYDPAVRKWPYDPATAKKLLAAAGFKPGRDGVLVSAAGKRFVVQMTTTSGNTMRELEETVIQNAWKAVGVELSIKNEPARTMFGQTLRQREFSGFVLYTRTPLPNQVPLAFLGTAYIPSQANNYFGQNYQGYSNPEMDTALAAAQRELDDGKRREIWKRIHAIVAEDLPVLPLFYATSAFVQPKWLQGMTPPPFLGSATAWIENWRPKVAR